MSLKRKLSGMYLRVIVGIFCAIFISAGFFMIKHSIDNIVECCNRQSINQSIDNY